MPTYNRLCAARAEQIERQQWEQYPEIMRQIYGWTARAAPERSGTDRQQTGDKNALTPRKKCGIIKAIRRHVRRSKRKQEGKKNGEQQHYIKTVYNYRRF